MIAMHDMNTAVYMQ